MTFNKEHAYLVYYTDIDHWDIKQVNVSGAYSKNIERIIQKNDVVIVYDMETLNIIYIKLYNNKSETISFIKEKKNIYVEYNINYEGVE